MHIAGLRSQLQQAIDGDSLPIEESSLAYEKMNRELWLITFEEFTVYLKTLRDEMRQSNRTRLAEQRELMTVNMIMGVYARRFWQKIQEIEKREYFDQLADINQLLETLPSEIIPTLTNTLGESPTAIMVYTRTRLLQQFLKN